MWQAMVTCWPSVDGDTPLHSAIKHFRGDINPIKLLLDHDDSDVNVVNVIGETPLHLAVQNKNPTVELIELLLEHKADVNVATVKGETPLHLAIKNERCLSKVTKLFLEHGADVKAKTPLDGNTPLHWAATMYDYNVIEHYRIVDFLVEHGGDVNAGNSDGDTPLHLAVRNEKEHPPILNLLYNGADVNATNLEGDTPLRLCLRESRSDTFILYLRELLQGTRDINAVDSKGDTLLHAAVRNEGCAKVPFIKMLLDHGADVDKEDATGKNAYQAYCHAVDKDFCRIRDPMLQILLRPKERQRMTNSSLHVACLLHNVDAVDKLLKSGAYVNDKRGFGHPPLFYALIAEPVADDKPDDKCSTVRLLLHHGADVNHKLYRPDAPMLSYRFFDNDYDTSLMTLLCLGKMLGWRGQLAEALRPIPLKHRAKLMTLDKKRAETGSKAKLLSKYNRREFFSAYACDAGIEGTHKDWFSRCYEELEAMSETAIGESRVSFLDFLLASAKETKIYADNEELVGALRAGNDMFPIYRGMLAAKLAKELERRKHSCTARRLFRKICGLFEGEPSFIGQNRRNKVTKTKC